jgi:pimeloyl-ACP methyl ester carboxylesterase/DNA-binding winged helix-turn-helix (wHTH) protein
MVESSGSYQFGPFRLDVPQRRLLRGREEITLRMKVFDTLRVLVENAGKLLTKDELLAALWPGTVVEENNLNHNISVLRKALGENATGKRFIETVPRIGYRFTATVEYAAGTETVASPHEGGLQRQEIRYCLTGDGVRLAYAGIGSGPPLVKASNWLTHLDYEWESPIWQHWWAELSKHHRVIRYDERGNGMSQRDISEFTFDTWVRDLETVVDAAGLDSFSLLGISRGGAIAIAYAVKHPERVNKLILYGAFPIGRNHYATPQEREARRALVSLTRLGWGVDNPAFCKLFTSRFIPNATPAHEHWFDDLQRVSTSAENAARLMETDDNIDVRGLLRQVQMPTLVVHCDRDQVVSPEQGRHMAAGISNARYVSLPSANHLLLAEEPAWRIFLKELGSFLEWRPEAALSQKRL